MTTTLTPSPPTVLTPPPWRGAGARASLRTEFRLFTREPIGLVWGVLLPTVAFVVVGCLPAMRQASDALGGGTFLGVYQTVLPLLGATMLALTAMPPVIGAYRERGVLRRYAVTPMPPAFVLGAQLTIHVVAALGTGLATLVIGAAAFDTSPGTLTWAWLLTFVVALPALLGLGLLIAALAPNAKVAGAVGTVLFFPMMFTTGLWIPRPTMPTTMRTVCDWTPLGAANRAMSAAVAGHVPSIFALLALAGYGVVLWALAVRVFRWS